MKRMFLHSTSHNTILSRISPMTSDSYREVMTTAAKHIGIV